MGGFFIDVDCAEGDRLFPIAFYPQVLIPKHEIATTPFSVLVLLL